jgi:hypothetical protein
MAWNENKNLGDEAAGSTTESCHTVFLELPHPGYIRECCICLFVTIVDKLWKKCSDEYLESRSYGQNINTELVIEVLPGKFRQLSICSQIALYEHLRVTALLSYPLVKHEC